MEQKYTNIFDSHAHYDDAWFDEDRMERLARMPEKGVCGIVNNGIDIQTSKLAVSYAEQFSFMYAAAGYHPETIENVPKDYLQQLEPLVKHKKTVAVGEIGLDYHWNTPRDLQKQYFLEQLNFAKQMNMPVIIHDREAHGDIMHILKTERPKGLVHCFSGSVETMREVIKLGMYISLGGVVTFKNARQSVEVAKEVPIDRLLLETDAPYLAPVPFRGKRCDSSMIPYCAEKIAELRGMEPQEVIDITRENALRMYNIKT